MKAQMMLLAGTMAGLALAATPVLSQERPETPGMQRPPTAPGQDRLTSTDFKQAMRMLEGSWQVSVKTFEGGAEASATPIQGTSTRRWVLNQNILQEDVRTSASPNSRGADGNFQVREPGSPNQTRPGGSMATGFEGHGMFGYDASKNEFQHIWADSNDTKLCYSVGRYDERTRTFTFSKEGSGSLTTPPARTTPPITTPPPTTPPRRPDLTPGSNPGGANPDDDLRMQATAPGQPTTPPPPRPSTPSTQRPASTLDLASVDRVVIRIQDDTRHTVEYYGAGQSKIMEITYTKSGSGALTR